MIILHIISGSLNSGAGKGAFLLHKQLLKLKIDSRILVLKGQSSKKLKIDVLLNSTMKIIFYKIIRITNNLFGNLLSFEKSTNFDPGLFAIGFLRHPWYLEADIVHLHWINGILSINQISKIDKPLIWTMRDMWPMTVGYHYYSKDYANDLFINNIVIRKIRSFLFKKLSRYKEKKFKKVKILFVGISNWISSEAKSSKILKKQNIKTILNVVDLDNFYPNQKNYLRKNYPIKNEKKIILLGAKQLDLKYKGFHKFIEAISYLDPKNIEIVTLERLAKRL